jgi:hypothetical protein
MTREEKAAVLKEKAAALIKTFEGRTLPAGSFKIKTWATVLDAEKYHSTNVAIINGSDNLLSINGP